MLQQTTVKAVIPYYERFLTRFPTVRDLAAASEEEVLKYWEGLGYYSRGRNLRLAARQVCEHHGGHFPACLEELQNLPGIGRYTAGAIRSFGHHLPAPIVEANTLRLYCRLLGLQGDPRSQSGQKLLWEFAERLQPARQAGHLNQALMELGATICTPNAPRCDLCPVSRFCRAFEREEQANIPMRKTRPEVTSLVEGTVAVQHENTWLIRQRSAEERWTGMWDFPRFPLSALPAAGKLSSEMALAGHREMERYLTAQTGLRVNDLHDVMQIRHSVTRYRIRLLCYATHAASQPRETRTLPFRWATLLEMQSLPMPMTGRKFVDHLLAESR